MEAPGAGTLPEQINDLRKRIAETTRVKDVRPWCQVWLNANPSYTASTDHWAQAGWQAVRDDYGMFTPGTSTFKSLILAPVAGFYDLHYHCAQQQTGGTGASKITRNGTDVPTQSVATDSRVKPGAGGDQCVLDAVRTRLECNAGDIFYWSNWASVAFTLLSSNFGIPTTLTVSYVGSR